MSVRACVRLTFLILKLSSFHLSFPFPFFFPFPFPSLSLFPSLLLPFSFNLLHPLFLPLQLFLALSSSPFPSLFLYLFPPSLPFFPSSFPFPIASLFPFPFSLPFPFSFFFSSPFFFSFPFFFFLFPFHFPSSSLYLPSFFSFIFSFLFPFHFSFPVPFLPLPLPLSLSLLPSFFPCPRPSVQYLRRHISVTVPDRRMVTKDLL